MCMFPMDSTMAGAILIKLSGNLQISPVGDPMIGSDWKFERR